MLFARFAAKALWGRAGAAVIRSLHGTAAALGFRSLSARPKGSALWIPAAFEKAGETFFCASRASL